MAHREWFYFGTYRIVDTNYRCRAGAIDNLKVSLGCISRHTSAHGVRLQRYASLKVTLETCLCMTPSTSRWSPKPSPFTIPQKKAHTGSLPHFAPLALQQTDARSHQIRSPMAHGGKMARRPPRVPYASTKPCPRGSPRESSPTPLRPLTKATETHPKRREGEGAV